MSAGARLLAFAGLIAAVFAAAAFAGSRLDPDTGDEADTSAAAQAAQVGDDGHGAANFPSSGPYRLFLQFRAGGTVHTVAYKVEVTR